MTHHKPERRHEAKRHKVIREFPGQFFDAENEHEIKLNILDVSPRGLGVSTRHKLKEGQHIFLVYKEHKIRLEIVYSNNYLGIENVFRSGLFAREMNANLDQLFLSLDLIEK